MTSFDEGELRFVFGDDWQAERYDGAEASHVMGVRPVDFIAEGSDELVLVEIKDPSAHGARDENRQVFIRKMQSKELTYQELVPKARTSYGYLHLMARDTKPMRYVVVIGIERLSIQEPLLLTLTDRLRARLEQETDTAWKRLYIAGCSVVSVAGFGKALSGCSASRTARGAK
jgi:hypothetical protein